MTSPDVRKVCFAAGCTLLLLPGVGRAQELGGATLTMDDAVTSALRNSPTLEIARRERNVALIGVDRDRPAFRPEVQAVGSQILRTPRVDLPGKADEVVLPNSISRLAIEVRQPLYQFGIGNAAHQRVDAQGSAARAAFRTVELDTVLQVREAFLFAIRTQGLLEIARRGSELAAENERMTRLLLDQGFQAEVDLLEAKRAVAEAQSGVVQAENGVSLARANLNRTMGRPIDAPLDLASQEISHAEPAALSHLMEDALRLRPEIEEVRQNIAAAEAGIRLAKAARQPRVNLEAAYALQTKTALVPNSGLSAGVSVTVPIFSGVVNRYSVREAEERVAQLKTVLMAREQGVALEIEQQRLAMREAKERMALAGRAIEAAEKALEIVRLRLEKGRAVQVEVQNARLSLVRALNDRVSAALDHQLAQARLDRAVGRGPTAESAATADGSKRRETPNERK